jgi:hypothetical protein
MRTLARGSVALGMAVAIACGGLSIGIAAVPASAATTQIALTDINDGSGPFDSSANNNTTETHDAVVYQVAYNSNTSPSTETFVVTLPASTPAGVQIDSSNLSLCTGGTGTISADGHTLTCPVDVPANTTGNLNVRVTVDGTVLNGTVINPTVTDGALMAGLDTPTTVVAKPQVSVAKNIGSGTFVTGGNAFINYIVTLSNPANQKGAALIDQPLTFTDSLAGLPAGSTVVLCGVFTGISGDAGVPWGTVGVGSANSANSATNSGIASCSQNGNQESITVSGAELTGNSIPTEDSTGLPLPKDGPSYLASYLIQVQVPGAEVPVGGLQTVNQITGFDPATTNADGSTTKQSDLPGGGVDPGANDGATCTYDATNAIPYCNSTLLPQPPTGPVIGLTKRLVEAPAPGVLGGTEVGGGAAGSGTVTANDTYWAILNVDNVGSSAAPVPTLTCDRWNPALQRLSLQGGAANTVVYQNRQVTTNYSVQYGVFAASANNVSGTTCDPISITWYPSVSAVPGGLDAIDALLITPTWNIQGSTTDAVNIQFEALANPNGTTIPDYSGLSTSAGATPADWSVGQPSETDRVTLLAEKLRVVKSVQSTANVTIQSPTQASVLAGKTLTYTLQPTITSGVSGVAGGVVVTDQLPSCVIYVPGSVTGIDASDVTYTPGDDGADGVPCTDDAGETGGTLTFQLGDIATSAIIPEITYDATAVATAPDSTLAPNTASITDPLTDQTLAANSTNAGLLADRSQRTVTYNTLIRDSAAFSISKTTSDPIVQLSDGFTDTIAWVNHTNTASTATMIDVLPYPGDARTTSTVGGSAFNGALQYSGSTANVPAGESVVVDCTTDPQPGINTDPNANTSTWSSACPPNSTALRIVATNVPSNGGSGSLQVAFADAGSRAGDQFVNTVGGARVTGQPLEITESAPAVTDVIASQITGVVWNDSNSDGLLDTAETGRVADVKVVLTGTNDKGQSVKETTDTAADGSYRFDERYSGNYTEMFTAPDGASWTTEHAGTTANDSEVNASGITDSIVLPAGGLAIANAGIIPAPTTLSTTISAKTGHIGDALSDRVTVAGTGGATLTGTWTLLGPVDPGAGATDCSTVDWTGAPVFQTGHFTAQGNGDTTLTRSNPVTAEGCYTYVESLNSTASTNAVPNTTAGLPSETAYIGQNSGPLGTALAFTGSNPLGLAVAGMILLALGLVAFVAIRRRRRTAER